MTSTHVLFHIIYIIHYSLYIIYIIYIIYIHIIYIYTHIPMYVFTCIHTYIYLATLHNMYEFIFQPGTEPVPPKLETQSLNH